MGHVDYIRRRNSRARYENPLDVFLSPHLPRGEQERVILPGLGLTNLTIARGLLGYRNVLGMEAEDHFGGRIGSIYMAGQVLDEGANWQHTPERGNFRNEPSVYSATISHDNFLHEIILNGKRADPYKFYRAHHAADQRINNNRVSGLSLEDLLTWEQVGYYGAFFRNQFCESDAGVEPEQVSADACLIEHQTNDGDVFKEGFERVIKNMFSETVALTPMLFNCPVIEIINGRDYATVITADGKKYYAEQVLPSPSVGVLKSGLIKFSPDGLPPKIQEALSGLRMGVLEKFILHMPQSFLSKFQDNQQIHILDANNKPLFAVVRPAGKPFLIFMTGGNHSRKLMHRTENELVHYFREALRPHYGNLDVLDFKHTKHQLNPYRLGSYSAEKVGHPLARKHLQDPFGRVKLTGEAFQSPFAGQVPAAYESGLAAVDWVLGRKNGALKQHINREQHLEFLEKRYGFGRN